MNEYCECHMTDDKKGWQLCDKCFNRIEKMIKSGQIKIEGNYAKEILGQ
jgi:hypothetical protein